MVDIGVFADSLRDVSYAGASVLPFALVGADVYMLLAKDRRVHRWAESEMITDAGGRVRAGEDPCTTAARELWEETCGALDWTGGPSVTINDAPVAESPRGMAESLQAGRYTAQLRYRMHGRLYICYVKEIPFDPHLPARHARVWHDLHARYHIERFRIAEGHVDADDDEREAQQYEAARAALRSVDGAVPAADAPTLRTQADKSAWSGPAALIRHPAICGRYIDSVWMEKKSIAWFNIHALHRACLHPTNIILAASGAASGVERIKPDFVARLLIVLESLFSNELAAR